jgi:hypothetical protein
VPRRNLLEEDAGVAGPGEVAAVVVVLHNGVSRWPNVVTFTW